MKHEAPSPGQRREAARMEDEMENVTKAIETSATTGEPARLHGGEAEERALRRHYDSSKMGAAPNELWFYGTHDGHRWAVKLVKKHSNQFGIA